MRENKNAIYITLGIIITSLAVAILITYCECVNKKFLNPDFVVNCLIGIFTGSFLSCIIAIVNYCVERKRLLVKEVVFLDELILQIVPIYYLFKNGQRNLEHEMQILSGIHVRLRDQIHLQPNEFQFFLPKTKIEKKLNEIDEILIELYSKVDNIKRLIDQYEFELIDDEVLDEKISEVYMYLRNYKGDLFTNVLGEKQKELSILAKLKFDYELKMDF